MARLIDADKLLTNVITISNSKGQVSWRAVSTTDILTAPTVDAVPVVRCKDCEYAELYERTDGTAGYYCGHPQNSFTYGERWDRVLKPIKETDGFCSYGARKDDSAT